MKKVQKIIREELLNEVEAKNDLAYPVYIRSVFVPAVDHRGGPWLDLRNDWAVTAFDDESRKRHIKDYKGKLSEKDYDNWEECTTKLFPLEYIGFSIVDANSSDSDLDWFKEKYKANYSQINDKRWAGNYKVDLLKKLTKSLLKLKSKQYNWITGNFRKIEDKSMTYDIIVDLDDLKKYFGKFGENINKIKFEKYAGIKSQNVLVRSPVIKLESEKDIKKL